MSNIEAYTIEGINYYKSNHRMMYNPNFHENQYKPWSNEDLAYLVQMRPAMKWKDLCMALGRTQSTCMNKYYMLKKKGLIDYYKNLEID